MKNLFLPTLAFLLLATAGCQQNEDAQAMLQNESERQEVYNVILEDEAMRNEMMEAMRERNMSGPMGQGQTGRLQPGDTTGIDPQQLQAQLQQMLAVCGTDTTACNMISETMLENRDLMGSMMRQIRQRGRMEPGCMQQLMREVDL